MEIEKQALFSKEFRIFARLKSNNLMKYDVFISYSRKDTAVADQICAAFDKAGITYFIDRQEIIGGGKFPEILADAIMESKLFIFLASSNSYLSKYTNKEIHFAFKEKPSGTLIPYIIDNTALPKGLQLIFSDINIRSIKDHPIDILVKDILSLLNNCSKEHTTNNTTKTKSKKTISLIFCIIVIATSIFMILKYYISNTSQLSSRRIKEFVELYRDATNNNNIVEIKELYAERIKRFYNYYDISRDSVISCYKSYEQRFQAHNPQSAIQWETIKADKTKDGFINLSFTEYYSLDREDNKKNSMWILKKHFLLDRTYKIVKEYEEQISKK